MVDVFSGFGVVVLILALGFAIGRAQVLGPNAVYTLNMFVFWIALPATLIRFMSQTDVADLFGVSLAVVALSTLAAGAIGFLGYRFIARRSRPDSLIAMLACSYCNGSNLGIPLAVHLLDDPTATLPVILFQVGFYAPLSIFLLDISSGRSNASFFRTTVVSIVRNPLILGAAVGIAISLVQRGTSWRLPELIAEPIGIIADATVACALIAFGMSMADNRVLQRGISPRRSVWAASVVKAVVHPLIAVGLAVLFFDATSHTLLTIAIIAALPTGQNVFTYAQRFGVNKVLARDTAVVSTGLSLPVMAALMLTLG